MLADNALRKLKTREQPYEVSDRDSMYVTVSPSGTFMLRYDYRLKGRRETLTIGRYGPAGTSLAMAREKLIDAKRAVAEGRSAAQEKQRQKRWLAEAKTLQELTERCLADAAMADSARAMRKAIIDGDILPVFRNRLLAEIGPDDSRGLCNKVRDRGAPATSSEEFRSNGSSTRW